MNTQANRREFLKAVAVGAAATTLPTFAAAQSKAQTALPRWRGFNLLDMFTMRSTGDWAEDDFKWIRDFGFDFVRLPAVYRLWIEDGDDYKIKESMLAKLDRAVDLGVKYGIHVSVNFHRGPGYSVNREFKEPFNLWKDQEALDAFCFHWAMLAKRYKGISREKLSFDLINEPPSVGGQMSMEDAVRVVRTAARAINDADPGRLVIADGVSWGRQTMPELADTKIGQSCRGYDPMFISHCGASWVNYQDYPDPAWPGNGWDRKRLEEHYQPWVDIAKKGVGVHCGECGCYNRTPHKIFLAWFRDVLEILTENNIGFAVWNFRGSFGIMDSDRKDIEYEDFHGHKLDRKLLDLLQSTA